MRALAMNWPAHLGSFRASSISMRALFGACSAITPCSPIPSVARCSNSWKISQAAAELGFSLMSSAIRAGIESVVVDCFPPYRRAAQRWVPWARIVLDKFHATKMIDDCAHRVRTRARRKRATNLPNSKAVASSTAGCGG